MKYEVENNDFFNIQMSNLSNLKEKLITAAVDTATIIEFIETFSLSRLMI